MRKTTKVFMQVILFFCVFYCKFVFLLPWICIHKYASVNPANLLSLASSKKNPSVID